MKAMIVSHYHLLYNIAIVSCVKSFAFILPYTCRIPVEPLDF